MTMPYGSVEEPEVTETSVQSIPVHVVSSDAKPGKSIAPEFGRWRTILVSSAVNQTSITPGAARLASRSLRRHRLHIIVNASVVAQPTIDGIIVGSRDEINTGMPAVPGQLGGYLQIGDSVRWECQAELWVCYPATNTNPVYVTVCDEVFASDPEAYLENEAGR
jgi:hypothetical protein